MRSALLALLLIGCPTADEPPVSEPIPVEPWLLHLEGEDEVEALLVAATDTSVWVAGTVIGGLVAGEVVLEGDGAFVLRTDAQGVPQGGRLFQTEGAITPTGLVTGPGGAWLALNAAGESEFSADSAAGVLALDAELNVTEVALSPGEAGSIHALAATPDGPCAVGRVDGVLSLGGAGLISGPEPAGFVVCLDVELVALWSASLRSEGAASLDAAAWGAGLIVGGTVTGPGLLTPGELAIDALPGPAAALVATFEEGNAVQAWLGASPANPTVAGVAMLTTGPAVLGTGRGETCWGGACVELAGEPGGYLAGLDGSGGRWVTGLHGSAGVLASALQEHEGLVGVGGFGGELDLGEDTPLQLDAAGNFDGWLARWDEDGEPLDALSLGGPLGDVAAALATSADGGLFVAGSFSEETVFPLLPGAPSLDAGMRTDGFLLRSRWP